VNLIFSKREATRYFALKNAQIDIGKEYLRKGRKQAKKAALGSKKTKELVLNCFVGVV